MSKLFKSYNRTFNNLFKGTIVLSFLFGLNTLLYINSQKTFERVLSKKEATRAISITSEIDQISFQYKIPQLIYSCSNIESESCKVLLEFLIQFKNRILDYQMIFLNVFDFQKNSKQITQLFDYANDLDNYIGNYFGLSPKNAKKLGIKNINAYLQEITNLDFQDKTLNDQKKLLEKIDTTRIQTYKYLNQVVSLIENQDISVEQLEIKLVIYTFTFLILEILIFILMINLILKKDMHSQFFKDSEN